MSGTADDSAAGGRHLRHPQGRRTRRTRRSEDEQPSEFTLPVADLDEDDPKTLAEDAQWAAKLRPGRAPAAGTPAPAEDPPEPATSADDPPAPTTPPASAGDPWDAYSTDGSGESWRPSVGGSAGDHTGGPWEATPAGGDDPWPPSPAGDWTAAGGAFEPEPPTPDWSLGEPPAAGGDLGTGSWAGAGSGASWEPDADPWSPSPPWEPDPPGQPFQAAEPSAARPWEIPAEAEASSFPATEPPVPGGDFGALFGELASDRQAEAPAPAANDPAPHEDPAVQAAHAEARRLIEEAAGRWLWDDEKPSRSGEFAAPATSYGSLPAQGLPQSGLPASGGHDAAAPGGYGVAGSTGPGGPRHAAPSGAWGDPLPPPPVPDAPASHGPGLSFAAPGSAPTEVGPSATPPPAGRELSHTRGPGRHEQPDEPGSRLWAPDRRADEHDAGGGVGWLWSVEEYGASPPVPDGWLREPPRQQGHEVDGLAWPVEGRRLRQLESRSHGRRVRPGRRWPVRVAVAAWIVLFAVVCWLYVFPWLEGVLPENF